MPAADAAAIAGTATGATRLAVALDEPADDGHVDGSTAAASVGSAVADASAAGAEAADSGREVCGAARPLRVRARWRVKDRWAR